MEELNPALVVTIVWVLLISLVGMLPMRFHKRLGFPMLALFPFVLGYLGWEKGIWWVVGLLAAGLSIYRYPAKYYGLKAWHRLTGWDAQ